MEEDSLKGKITINAIRWPAIIVEDSTEYLSALNRAIVHWCLVGEGCLLIDTLMRAAKAVIIDKLFQNAMDGLNLSCWLGVDPVGCKSIYRTKSPIIRLLGCI